MIAKARALVLHVARLLVLGGLCTGATCTSSLPPGETRHKSPEAIRGALHCDKQTLPYFVVDRNTITPPRVSGGGELRHILIYSMCPIPNGATVRGTLVRRVKLGDETILEDATEPFELKPGRWVVTALVRVPPGASAGKYVFDTEIRAATLHYDGEQRFEIKEGK